jgi:hypothetical protein
MPPVGFKPTLSAGERLETYALDRATIGTGYSYDFTAENLVVIMYTTCCNINTLYFDHPVYLCVSCDSESKQLFIL